MSGFVILTDGGLVFAFEGAATDRDLILQPPGQKFRAGRPVLLAEPDGSLLRFNVAHLQAMC